MARVNLPIFEAFIDQWCRLVEERLLSETNRLNLVFYEYAKETEGNIYRRNRRA